MGSPRRLTKFESADGTRSVTFPPYRFEQSQTQSLGASLARIIGGSYAVDLLGGGTVPKAPGSEQVTCTIVARTGAEVDAQEDAIRGGCKRIELGKLYSKGADGSLRWSWARLVDMPATSYSEAEGLTLKRVTISFTRISNWFGQFLLTDSEPIAATPHLWSITTAGNAPVEAMIIRLKAQAAGGFTNPTVRNKTNGERFQILKTAAGPLHELRIDTGRYAVEESFDGGLSYSDAMSALVLLGVQFNILTLAEEAVNELELIDAGTPNLIAETSWYETWH